MTTLHVFQFTYTDDGPLSVESMKSVRRLYSDARITIVEQADSPLTTADRSALELLGCDFVVSAVERRGNLNGRVFIDDALSMYNASTCDYILKIDSDTMLTGDILAQLIAAEKDALFFERIPGRQGYGACYIIKQSRVASLIANATALWAYVPAQYWGEDQVISGLCISTFGSAILWKYQHHQWIWYDWNHSRPPFASEYVPRLPLLLAATFKSAITAKLMQLRSMTRVELALMKMVELNTYLDQ